MSQANAKGSHTVTNTTIPDLDWADMPGGESQAATVNIGTETFRLTLTRDDVAESPADDDGTVPMVYLDNHYQQTYDGADDVKRAWEHYRDEANTRDPYALLERWLRIYVGATRVATGHIGAYQGSPLVVTFDTPAWRELTGWTPELEGDPAAQSLKLWRQWAEGDVYVVTIEQLRNGITQWEDGEETPAHDWAPIDSLAGLYGEDYAKEQAAEMLAEHQPQPNQYPDQYALDCLATLLGTSSEWSSAADYLESVADLVGTVRPHPGNYDADVYARVFHERTGRTAPESWIHG